MHIIVDVSKKRLFLKEGEKVVFNFPIGIGRFGSPTPLGVFSIISKIDDPQATYVNGEMYGAGCLNLSLWADGRPYAIHGTNEPGSIGRAKSSGCIRLHDDDFKQLFEVAYIGMQVIITMSPDA